MGGENSVMDMIVRYRQNMEMLRKKGMFRNGKNYLIAKEEYTHRKGNLDYKKATKEQLLEIRTRIKKERKHAWLQFIVTFVIVASVFILIMVKIGSVVFAPNQGQTRAEKFELERLETQNQYNFYISDGDNWFRKGKWYNASFEYKKALSIYPNDYVAQHRLAISYLELCRHRYKHNEIDYCNHFEVLINQLITEYPKADSLLLLKRDFETIPSEITDNR